MALAAQPHRFAWGVIDPNLWLSCMTGKALPSCPRCRLSHPTPGPFCPFRSGPSPAPSFGSGGPSRQTIFTHSGKPVCRNFNTGSCDSTQCTRAHVCFLCRGNHSAHSCRAGHTKTVATTARNTKWTDSSPTECSHTYPRSCTSFVLLLSHHPDKSFSTYVSQGMSQGFAVGFRSPSAPLACLCSSSNHPSALRNRQFVSTYLQSSYDSSQTAGPFTQPPFPHMHVSGLGIVPKKNGKLRVIHDLSSQSTETVLSYYAAHLSATLQPTSVRTYMLAIRNLHVELGYDYPSGPTTLLCRVV